MNKSYWLSPALAIILIAGLVLSIGQLAYSQGPQYKPHFNDPSVPYPTIYNTVAASQTGQALHGAGTGATGDFLASCLVIPTTVSPGSPAVTIIDNATSIVIFAGGASSLPNLQPFTIDVGAVSALGPWKVTTGSGLSVVCTGSFS